MPRLYHRELDRYIDCTEKAATVHLHAGWQLDAPPAEAPDADERDAVDDEGLDAPRKRTRKG